MYMSLGDHMCTSRLCFEMKKDEQFKDSAAQVCYPFYLFLLLMYF